MDDYQDAIGDVRGVDSGDDDGDDDNEYEEVEDQDDWEDDQDDLIQEKVEPKLKEKSIIACPPYRSKTKVKPLVFYSVTWPWADYERNMNASVEIHLPPQTSTNQLTVELNKAGDSVSIFIQYPQYFSCTKRVCTVSNIGRGHTKAAGFDKAIRSLQDESFNIVGCHVEKLPFSCDPLSLTQQLFYFEEDDEDVGPGSIPILLLELKASKRLSAKKTPIKVIKFGKLPSPSSELNMDGLSISSYDAAFYRR